MAPAALIGWSAGCPGDSSWGGVDGKVLRLLSELPPRGASPALALERLLLYTQSGWSAHKLGAKAKAELPIRPWGCKGGSTPRLRF